MIDKKQYLLDNEWGLFNSDYKPYYDKYTGVFRGEEEAFETQKYIEETILEAARLDNNKLFQSIITGCPDGEEILRCGKYCVDKSLKHAIHQHELKDRLKKIGFITK